MVDDGKLDVLDRVGLQVPSWAIPNFPPKGLDNRGSLEVPIPGDDILLTLKGKKVLMHISKNKKKQSITAPAQCQLHKALLGCTHTERSEPCPSVFDP